jgi:DNA anti-recombination protein RmuC
MEKTVKIRAFPDVARSSSAQGNTADEKAIELAMKDAQIEEERSRSLEHLKTIVQLRESLKQEQAKTAEMARKADELDAKAKGTAALETNELARKSAELEEEKQKSLEQMKTIEQLREGLRQEQAKAAGMADMMAELDAKAKERAALETKVKELTGALGKIAAIAAAWKAG